MLPGRQWSVKENRLTGSAPQPSAEEEAFRQVLAHRTMLAAYVRAIVHDPVLAEDTFADIGLAIARSWNSYDTTRPFAPWARGVARRVALANLRKARKHPVLLGTEVLDAVGEELDGLGEENQLIQRKDALRECLERLPDNQRKLVHLKYFRGMDYTDLADRVERSVDALYVAFSRIHRRLGDCIEKRLRLS